jgi:putative inorganic carbon (hco3(-)) transporter
MKNTRNLKELHLKTLWEYIVNERILYWLLCLYILFEYVRPQTIYPAIDIIPFAKTVLILTIVVFFGSGKTFSIANIENKLLISYLAVILLSSLFAFSPEVSFSKIYYFIAWILIYFLIINIVDTEERFIFLIFIFLLFNFKMSQYSFRGWVAHGFSFVKIGTGGGPGWFRNSGEFGIEMCIFFPISFYFYLALKDYWPIWKKVIILLLPASAISGMVSSSSRGALVGGAGVLFWILLKSKHKVLGLCILAVISFVIYSAVPEESKSRFQTAGQDTTSMQRLNKWKEGLDMVNKNPILGIGFENYQIADVKIYGGNGILCHNIFIQCMSELGYAGLTIFVLMILFTFKNNYDTRQLAQKDLNNKFIYYMAHSLDGALIGYLISGFFVTVLYYPYFWINLAMTVALNNISKQISLENRSILLR